MTEAPAYQGLHLLAELHDASGLSELALVETALLAGAAAAGATVIKTMLHHFGAGQGVTGVVLLAESHLSIHTWPEHGYAAVDIFVCGATNDAQAALDEIAARLQAGRVTHQSLPRGYAAG